MCVCVSWKKCAPGHKSTKRKMWKCAGRQICHSMGGNNCVTEFLWLALSCSTIRSLYTIQYHTHSHTGAMRHCCDKKERKKGGDTFSAVRQFFSPSHSSSLSNGRVWQQQQLRHNTYSRWSWVDFFCQPTVTQYEAAYTTTHIEERKSPPRHLGVAFTAAQHHQPPPSLSLDIKGDTYGHHSLNTSERKRPWKAELCYAAALITQRVIQSPPSIYPEKRDMTHKAVQPFWPRGERSLWREAGTVAPMEIGRLHPLLGLGAQYTQSLKQK